MFSIGKDWIFCFKINGSESDFLENLYDHGICFGVAEFKEQWE
jgi:hypothetical protein